MQETLNDINYTHKATSVSDAINTRHSIREFKPDPVSQEILSKILETALRAPSWKNTQPWEIHAVVGSKRDRISELMIKEALAGNEGSPDSPWPTEWTSAIRKQMFQLGLDLYGAAGIDRKDKEARMKFMLNNFKFFDAPVGLFIFTPVPQSFWTGLDIGCLMNNIMLLTREAGLGSIAQGALSAYPDIIRKELNLAEDKRLVCGLSLGYPTKASGVNKFHSARVAAEKNDYASWFLIKFIA